VVAGAQPHTPKCDQLGQKCPHRAREPVARSRSTSISCPNPDWGDLALSAIACRSGHCLRARVSSDYLRRLAKGAQEGAAHAVAIGKTRLPNDDVDRAAALLHHQPGGFDAQVLDRLGRQLAGLGAEGTAELART
jgi:hypothetical protein